MAYDSDNVFAKILRGEIACRKIYEDDFVLSFHDINPQAPIHFLVIPKGPYATYDDFISSAEDIEIVGFFKGVEKAIIASDAIANGYRIIANTGSNSHQEVPHYHVHVLGGRDLGPMLSHK